MLLYANIVFKNCFLFLLTWIQIAFKRVLGEATSGQVALLFTVIGFTNLLLFSPVIFVLDHLDLETIDWHQMPWPALAGTAVLQLVFNYLVSFGIAFTFPLFISIGILLSVPFNAAADAIFRGEGFGLYKIVALVLIIIGFMLLLIPVRKLERLEKKVRCGHTTKEKHRSVEDQQLQSCETDECL